MASPSSKDSCGYYSPEIEAVSGSFPCFIVPFAQHATKNGLLVGRIVIKEAPYGFPHDLGDGDVASI